MAARFRHRLSRIQLRPRHQGRAGSRSPAFPSRWSGTATPSVPASDLIVLPGGFSYGDYLRCGAMAAHSPIMRDVIAKAKAGTPVLGICNGFQVLCEAGLLPGVLMRNASLKFICRDVWLQGRQRQDVLHQVLPQGPGDPRCRSRTRRATISPTPRRSTGSRRRAASCSATATRRARSTAEANPNGAQRNIAGICDETGRILGLMPHPGAAVRAGARRRRRPPHDRERAFERRSRPPGSASRSRTKKTRAGPRGPARAVPPSLSARVTSARSSRRPGAAARPSWRWRRERS